MGLVLSYSGKLSREKTLSRIGRKGAFYGVLKLVTYNGCKNVHGWLKNREIREALLPQKLPAIYTVCEI